MIVALAGDHAGFAMKGFLAGELKKEGFEVLDLGAYSDAPSDYPDFARAAGEAVLARRAERGIIICGSGVGASVAANKMKGIRAAVCHDTYSGRQGVEHDDMNVLCLGARVIGTALAWEIVRAFLSARFSNEERHRNRVNKILAMEQRRE
jgi:ribose 5-phosphate isomerase B